MYTAKQKQTRRYRRQTSGYQWGDGSGEGQERVWDQEVQTTMYKIDKQQGYIVQHREIYPLFKNNFKWTTSINILNDYVLHLKHIIL